MGLLLIKHLFYNMFKIRINIMLFEIETLKKLVNQLLESK